MTITRMQSPGRCRTDPTFIRYSQLFLGDDIPVICSCDEAGFRSPTNWLARSLFVWGTIIRDLVVP